MNETLQIRNNRLYVVHEYNADDKPERIKLWWPAIPCQNLPRAWPEQDTCKLFRFCSIPDGRYRAYFYAPGATNHYMCATIELPEGGRTKAEFIETEPIPSPTKRIETRYRAGRWEKHLKSRGWVAA